MSFNLDSLTALYLQSGSDKNSVVLLYDSYEKKFHERFHWNVNRIIRNGNCLEAVSSYYLLSDVNGDGLTDMGYVEERIARQGTDTASLVPEPDSWTDEPEPECDDSQPYIYTINPVTWFLFDGTDWYSKPYPGEIRSGKYVDLKMHAVSSVERAALEIWKTRNPLQWNMSENNAGIFIPQNRLEPALKEVNETGDAAMAGKLKNYRNPSIQEISKKFPDWKWDPVSYPGSEILKKADRFLSEKAGERLMKYFTRSGALYNYTDENMFEIRGDINETDNTAGDFLGAIIRWKFQYPDYPWIKPFDISMHLDKDLNLKTDPDLSVIPSFVLENRTPELITRESALKTGEEKLSPEGREYLEASIDYEHDEGYFWKVEKKIEYKGCLVITGSARIDLLTGEIIRVFKQMWIETKCD